MIYINIEDLELPHDWIEQADALTEQLLALPAVERTDFINDKRLLTWGNRRLVEALINVIGNKCWYSEIRLEGQDPNVDHFRPKGRVVEISTDHPYTFDKTGIVVEHGYWWLAFQWKNFRLSSMHANQRRVDPDTNGGKADFFPVNGPRAIELTPIEVIDEDVLPLDPCVLSDMELIWFDPDGKPGFKNWKRKPTDEEVKRLTVSTWLYHLNKNHIVQARASHVADIRNDLVTADAYYKMWNPNGPDIKLSYKIQFNLLLNKIRSKTASKSVFAGAKRCAVRTATAKYPWISDYNVL